MTSLEYVISPQQYCKIISNEERKKNVTSQHIDHTQPTGSTPRLSAIADRGEPVTAQRPQIREIVVGA
jgi:hypothetical protein